MKLHYQDLHHHLLSPAEAFSLHIFTPLFKTVDTVFMERLKTLLV